jgi:hypothetical protein
MEERRIVSTMRTGQKPAKEERKRVKKEVRTAKIAPSDIEKV